MKTYKISEEIINKGKELLKEQLKHYEAYYRNATDEFYKKSYWRNINRLQASLDMLSWIIYNSYVEEEK